MRISDWSSDVCSSDLAAGALQMAANRVAAVAQVHRNFYADEAEEVTVVGFLRRLCADLSRILDREIEVRGDEGAVPTILVQPIGLITNEFVTNAAKHAAGRIEIIYTIKDGLHELMRSEEHTSELQSLIRISYAVFCLKKK